MISVGPTDRLYDLLPRAYRTSDAEHGYPLRALMRLIGREADVVEADLRDLYAAWFIETCPDWVVPYIGDLIGFVPAAPAGDPANLDVSAARSRLSVLIPRRNVANTIHDRRRKGTLALLEGIARDAAGWPAVAVEFYRRLARMQQVNALHLERGGTASLRHGRALADVDGPFSTLPHTVDVRRPSSMLSQGRYNIPSVALFAWRLRAFSVSHCQADCAEQAGPHCFTFSALGNDTELFNLPSSAAAPPSISHEHGLPVPITRRMLEERLPADPDRHPPLQSIASADFYGIDKSLAIWAPDWPFKGAPQPVPRERIIPADLSQWSYVAPQHHIAVDPELGRFEFPPRQTPRGSVYVSYGYGFSAPIGGGEYDRRLVEPTGAVVYRVARERPGALDSIGAALQRWRSASPRPRAAVIEIADSSVYTEPLAIALERNETLQLRAANGARPILRLLDYHVDRPDGFSVRGLQGSSFILDGVLVTGRGLSIHGPDVDDGVSAGDDLCEVVIRHSTLVPGWSLRADCEPVRPSEASIRMIGTRARLQIEHSIVGSIVILASESASEPVSVALSDSILDATGHDCMSAKCEALTAPNGVVAHATAAIRRCTVFGRIHVHAIELAENSLFTGPLRVARRQSGCMRFCYVPRGSRTPPRYECQPDRAIEANGGLYAAEIAAVVIRVRPQFVSTRYGAADYARLADGCAREIRQGADDQSEMGVFHDLYEPQRAALLQERLTEFTPAGMDAGLIFMR